MIEKLFKKIKSIILNIIQSNVIKACNDVAKLPPNDPKRIKAQKIIDKEYGACFMIEAYFLSKWGGYKYFKDLQEAFDFAFALCEFADVLPIKSVKYSKTNNYSSYAAFTKTIRLAKVDMSLTTLIHEVSHHIHSQRHSFMYPFSSWHGGTFLKIEGSIFDKLLELQKKYYPKAVSNNSRAKHLLALQTFTAKELLSMNDRRK
jgi:hypothetical protein